MNIIRNRITLVLGVLIFFYEGALGQNAWRIVDESGEITLVSQGRLRQSWGDDAMIMDGKENRIVFLSAERKSYATGTPTEYCGLVKEAQEAMIAKLPPDQRMAFEELQGKGAQSKGVKVEVKLVGPGGKVSGLETNKYAVYVDGKLHEELWLATDPDFLKQFKPLVGLFRGFSQCVRAMTQQDEVETSKEYLDLYEKGIEVKVRRGGEGLEEEGGQEATIEKAVVAESEFAVPAGYKKIDLRTFVFGQMGAIDDK